MHMIPKKYDVKKIFVNLCFYIMSDIMSAHKVEASQVLKKPIAHTEY